MNYPEILFKDVYWTFSIGAIETVEQFVNEMEK